MNTLLANSLNETIKKWDEYKQLLLTITNDETKFPLEIKGVQGSLYGFLTADYAKTLQYKRLHNAQYDTANKNIPSSLLIVVPSEKDEIAVSQDINAALPEAKVIHMPWWGMVSYRPVAKGALVFSERAGVLSKLLEEQKPKTINLSKDNLLTPTIFIMNQRTFLTTVPPPEYISSLSFTLHKNQKIDTIKLAEKLIEIGYNRVPRVSVHGEFALRGEVLDIFLSCDDFAHRVVFDFDTIENIKQFSPDTQSTIDSVDQILVNPMKEVIWTQELINKLETELKKSFLDSEEDLQLDENSVNMNVKLPLTDRAKEKLEEILTELEISKESEGEELLYSALWSKKYSVLDYISDNTTVVYYDYDRLLNAQESINREYSGMYRKARLELPVLSPNDFTFQFKDLSETHNQSIIYKTLTTEISENEQNTYSLNCEPPRNYFGNINYLKEQLENLQNDDWNIYIFADNENQSLRISELLKDFTSSDGKKPVTILPTAISAGFEIPDIKLLVIQENEIFGRRKHVPKSLHKVKSSAIDTFVELNPGDYVVHVNYGIGIFKGIERVKSMGNERDYIKLEYADEDVAFVPIEQVNLVQRYIGNEGESPRVDRIGSKSWENRKNKVKKSVEELAQKLIDLYSRRKTAQGFPFPKDTEWQTAFEAAFPYEDTPDQMSVTAEIKADMEKPVPMDRLVCGDVGYGKTEIAMRAAFKAVLGGKQVAFLAPTTILAEQHFETCVERFSNFPVTIAQLSRFITPAEQKKTLKKLAEGSVDILVGTHRIIQKDVVFKNLGLLIIDEEQRFGVKDKEKLKEIKNNIDCLSMSATPIPRTLHMSLLKIRDMSLLTTPPQNRQPIETVVDEINDERIITAIRHEVERGGQVFYLHNRVESLEETRLKLESLLPEMMVDIAHGQMTSDQLDDIFRRFKMGGFHVLVATTIIENGIDIPNVNTIIIDRADMYGISQLYQLRGRVGRSDRKAYAYLFYPKNRALSEIAMKRLQVISDFTELGSGFKIAMKDMEIRGAGNLLGRDQSGDVYSVGFDMYLRLLNDAVNARMANKGEDIPQNEVLMELEYTGYIPDSYVHSPQTKMEIYKKIAAIETKDELYQVYNELEDRFGQIPDEVLSLLTLSEIRIICKSLYISTLKEKNGMVQVEFSNVSHISIDRILRLIKENTGRIKLDATKPNMLLIQTGKLSLKEKSDYLCEKLEFLVNK